MNIKIEKIEIILFYYKNILENILAKCLPRNRID